MDIKTCPQCFAEINITCKHCPECGKNFQITSSLAPSVFCINASCRIPIAPTAQFCLKCGASQTTIPAPVLARRNKDVSHPASLAILLSMLLPGGGQAYNMQTWKALIFLLFGIVWFFIIYSTMDFVPASIAINPQGAFNNLVIISLLKTWITFAFIGISLVDAGVIAARINAGKAISEWTWF